MLVSYQAEKIQHLTVSGLLDFFWKDRIVDVQKIGTVSSGLMDFFSKDEIVDVQTLIRRTHHPAGRIERIFVFTNFDRKQSNKIFLQVLNIQDIRSQTMHIFDFLILANFQNFLLNCNHSAIKSSILNVNMTDES